ncbi:MAG TPA: hypothetical protein VIY30_11990, partial [Burkholderiaceae bacterium]
CDSCHTVRAWGLWSFDHVRRTKYAIDGAHTKVACERCHTQPAPASKAAAGVGTNCVACHRRDDTHDGAFGPGCEQCHATDSWKRIRTRVGFDEPQRTVLWALGYSSHLSGDARAAGRP